MTERVRLERLEILAAQRKVVSDNAEAVEALRRLPIPSLLGAKGFRPAWRRRLSATYKNLPNVPGRTDVFYGTKMRRWYAKYFDPYGRPVTGSVIDLWQRMYATEFLDALADLKAAAEVAGFEVPEGPREKGRNEYYVDGG